MMRRVIDDTRKVYGGDHSNLATALSNQGVLLYRAGRHEAALRALEQALAMRRRILPAVHPEIASSLQSLGVLASNTGEMDLAELYLVEALELRRKLFADAHPLLGSTAKGLADTLWKQQRPEEALPLYREAQAIFEATLPPDSPRILKAREAVERAEKATGDG